MSRLWKASSLTLTGGVAGESLDLTKGSSTLNTLTATVDASALKSDLTIAAAANTGTTVTAAGANIAFTGGAAADTLIVVVRVEVTSAITASDGGAGSDTLTAYVDGSASLANMESFETINLIAAAGDMHGNRLRCE